MNNIMKKFDFVIGNPPYQLGNNSHFYKKFIDLGKTLSDDVSLIVPSSYFGKSSSFDNLTHYSYNGMNFKNVELVTSWFIWKKNYNGPCKVLFKDTNLIVPHISISPTDNPVLFQLVNRLIIDGIEGFEIDGGHLWRKDAINDDNGIWSIWTCGRDGEDFDKSRISENQKHLLSGLGEHKVVFTEITGHKSIGHLKYADPFHGCAGGSRYIKTDNKEQALNLILYLKSKFVMAISIIIKATSKHNTKSVFDKIPKIDINRRWTDEEIYEFFSLTTDEIQAIKLLY